MLRFTFVGDSMTIGSAGELTWRYRMWQHLRAAYGDGAFEIAGPRETLYDKTANAAVSHDYADADPHSRAPISRAGARAGCTWRPSSRRRSRSPAPTSC